MAARVSARSVEVAHSRAKGWGSWLAGSETATAWCRLGGVPVSCVVVTAPAGTPRWRLGRLGSSLSEVLGGET
jgi:hypothetical protein